MQSENSGIENQYKTLSILWFALLASQFMFLVVIFFVKPEAFNFDFKQPISGGESSVIVIALAGLGVMLFFMSFVFKFKFLKQSVDEQNPALVQTATIVACALCEAATLFGLVLAFAFAYQYFFLWFVLGILGIILHFPKRENLIAASYKKA